MPSPCAPLTSAPCLSSVRNASRSPFIAPSATGELEAAARTADTPHAMATLERNRRFIASLTEAAGLGLPRRHEGTKAFCTNYSSCLRVFVAIHSRRGCRRRQRELPRAVAERLQIVEPELMQQGQHHIGPWRAVRRFQVHVPLEPAIGMTEHNHRAPTVIVN